MKMAVTSKEKKDMAVTQVILNAIRQLHSVSRIANMRKSVRAIPVDVLEIDNDGHVLARVVECLLLNSEQPNGALGKQLARLGLPAPRKLEKHEMTAEVVASYRDFQRALDPTRVRNATVLSVVPLSSAAAIAAHVSDSDFLAAMGLPVPEVVQLEQQQAELAGEGLVSLVVDDRVNELRAGEIVSLAEELVAYEPFEENAQDNLTVGSYVLQPGRHLKAQLKQYIQYKTSVYKASRESAAVAKTTAQSDCDSFLRFLGWRAGRRGGSALQCLSELLELGLANELEGYVEFLSTEREQAVSAGSIANYMNSLMNVLAYTQAQATQLAAMIPGGVAAGLGVLAASIAAAGNLRGQAEAEAKKQRLHKPRKPDWVSWEEAKQTRLNVAAAIAALPRTAKRKERLQLMTDELMISFHTLMPPDRVGVVRMLSIGQTLRKQLDSRKDHYGHYFIDLTKFCNHKTAKFYGPCMTPVSTRLTPLLDDYLKETQSQLEFSEFDEDEEANRTRRRYLFPMASRPSECMSSSNWGGRVKAAFKRFSPGGKAPCPSLLRSAFITALRESSTDPELLQSAATAQKHSIEMQPSDTYDLDTHIRLTAKAMEWCEQFAAAPMAQPEPSAVMDVPENSSSSGASLLQRASKRPRI